MNSNFSRSIRPSGAPAALAALLTLALTISPEVAMSDSDDAPPPEISHDGLHLVTDSEAAVAYIKPDVDFSIYERVTVLDCSVAFRQHWQRDINRARTMGSRVTDADAKRIREDVAALCREAFVQELESDDGYEVVDHSASDVLVVRPVIIDLDIASPDVGSTGRNRTAAKTAGGATLFIELYDSVSGEILARAIDRREARTYGRMRWSNRASNTAEARRVMQGWASVLRKRLDAVSGG